MILNTVNTSDLADFQLRNYPFASFEDFTKAVDASVQAKNPKEKTLVAETIKLVKERAEQFAKCEKLIQSTDITKPEELNKLKKELSDLKKLDEDEDELYSRWVALGGQVENYFVVMRDRAGMIVANKEKNAYVMEFYASTDNSVYATNDFKQVYKLYPHPTLAASSNALQEEAKRDYVNAVVVDGLVVPSGATAQADAISAGLPIIVGQANTLGKVLDSSLKKLNTFTVSVVVGKQKALVPFNLSIAAHMAKEEVKYKAEVEKFVKGNKSDLSSELINEIDAQCARAKSNDAGVGALNKDDVVTSVTMTVLLQQLSIARALTTSTPTEAARKALVVNNLVGRLGNIISNSPPSQLPAAAKLVLANNLAAIRVENSKALAAPTGNTSLDALTENLTAVQLVHALGVKVPVTLDNLITKAGAGQDLNAATVTARTFLKDLNTIIEFEGADQKEIESAVTNQLDIINSEVNQTNFGVLVSLILIRELRTNNDPRMQVLLQPLLTKLNNKVESQLPNVLKPEFAALKLASFPASTRAASGALANDKAVTALLGQNLEMKKTVSIAAEGQIGDVEFATKSGLFLSSATRNLTAQISQKTTVSLDKALRSQLKPLFDAKDIKNQQLTPKVFRDFATDSKQYEASLKSIIVDGKFTDLNKPSFVDKDLKAQLSTIVEKQQVTNGVRVIVLLDRLSIATNFPATTSVQKERKALIIQSIADELSNALGKLDPTSLPPGELAQIGANLDTIKQKFSGDIPNDKSNLGELRRILMQGQMDPKEKVATKFGLNELIDHLDTNKSYDQLVAQATKLIETDLEDVLSDIKAKGVTFENINKLNNVLEAINAQVNNPSTGVLSILVLIQVIRDMHDPLLMPLLVKLNNKLENQLPPELRKEFSSLGFANFLDKDEKFQKLGTLHSDEIAKVFAIDPDMQVAVTKDKKSKRYEEKLKQYFEIEKARDPDSHKNFRDLIDLPLDKQLPVAQQETHLKAKYDNIFTQIKNNPGKEEGVTRLAVTKEEDGANNIHVDQDPLPAVYYWIRKANACTEKADKEICYNQITRLLGKVPAEQQGFFMGSGGESGGSMLYFSEEK